jgi:hypothetical protein
VQGSHMRSLRHEAVQMPVAKRLTGEHSSSLDLGIRAERSGQPHHPLALRFSTLWIVLSI